MVNTFCSSHLFYSALFWESCPRLNNGNNVMFCEFSPAQGEAEHCLHNILTRFKTQSKALFYNNIANDISTNLYVSAFHFSATNRCDFALRWIGRIVFKLGSYFWKMELLCICLSASCGGKLVTRPIFCFQIFLALFSFNLEQKFEKLIISFNSF